MVESLQMLILRIDSSALLTFAHSLPEPLHIHAPNPNLVGDNEPQPLMAMTQTIIALLILSFICAYVFAMELLSPPSRSQSHQFSLQKSHKPIKWCQVLFYVIFVIALVFMLAVLFWFNDNQNQDIGVDLFAYGTFSAPLPKHFVETHASAL